VGKDDDMLHFLTMAQVSGPLMCLRPTIVYRAATAGSGLKSHPDPRQTEAACRGRSHSGAGLIEGEEAETDE